MAPPVVMKYIAAGFKADVENILQQFSDTKSYQFSVFANIWRASSFSLVFMGRENDKELREFIEECLNIVVSYLTPIVSLRQKVGAIYMLYGLHMKQPMEKKCKIRIQAEHFKEIKSILDFAKASHVLSLSYVIAHLFHFRSFAFVALPKLMGPRATLAKDHSDARFCKLDDLKSSMKEFLNDDNIKELEIIHNQYVQTKESLGPYAATISYVNEHPYEEFKREATELITNDRLREHVEGPSEKKLEGIGVRRAELKSKQFQKTTAGNRSKFHCQQPEEAEGAPVTKIRCKSKIYIKKNRKREKKRGVLGRPRKYPKVEDSDMEADTDDPSYNIETSRQWPQETLLVRKRGEKGRKRSFHFLGDDDESISEDEEKVFSHLDDIDQ